MSNPELMSALTQAIANFAQRIANATGLLIKSMAIEPETGDLRVTYSDDSVVSLGVVRGGDGSPGVSILDVELYVDPLDQNQVFIQSTLSNGIILRTQNSLSGYNGSSIKDVLLENNQLIFTLDDPEQTTLTPIPVEGLQAVSVVGAVTRDDGNGPEIFWQLSNGTELSSGIAEDLRGRGIESLYKEDGQLKAVFSNNPEVVVIGEVASITDISMVQGSLKITLDTDPENPIDLGPIGSITGAFVEGNHLKFNTNQPAPNDLIDVGEVANLKGDAGVGVASVVLDENNLIITLSDETVLPAIPVSGLTPISVVGARFDTDEDELYLLLSNEEEIPTGISTEIRGRGIVAASLGAAGELYLNFSDAPATPVQVGTVPAVIDTDIEQGMLRVYYSTDPETPVNVGLVLGIAGVGIAANGVVTVTYTDESTEQAGTLKAVQSMAVEAGALRVYYNDGTNSVLGQVVGPKGNDGVGIVDAEISPTGDLLLHKTDSSTVNAGFVRSTIQNLIGQSYTSVAIESQTVFPYPHEGNVLFFIEGMLVDDADLNLELAEEIVYTGTPLTGGEKIKVIVYSTQGVSASGKGVVSVELTEGSTTAYRITLEDNTDFIIETATPINVEDLPPGIANVVVLPNGNLQITLTNTQVIDAGPTSNAINTTNAYIDVNGDLHVVLSDSTDINVGSVVSNLSIEDAQIIDGDLVLTFTGGGEINAGPTGVYPTAAEINNEDELIITLSNGTELNAGVVINPLLGSIYDFICFEGQFEFPVIHTGFNVLVYANGSALSAAAIDLSTQYVRVSIPRGTNDVVRVVLLSAGNVMAFGLVGQDTAPNESYFGKNAAGSVGFHPLALTKYAQPYNFTATSGQTVFAVPHNGINSVEVFVDGTLRHDGYTAPAGQIVMSPGLTAGQKVRINLLRLPRTNGDMIIGNYARVAYEIYGNGGSFAHGAYRVRALNAILADSIGITIDSNRIILPAGKYFARGYAACVGVRQNVLRLFGQTTNATLLQGGAAFAAQVPSVRNTAMECHTPIEGYFEIPVQSAVVLQHRGSVTINTYGFGRGTAGGLDSTLAANALGIPGRLVDLQLWKVE